MNAQEGRAPVLVSLVQAAVLVLMAIVDRATVTVTVTDITREVETFWGSYLGVSLACAVGSKQSSENTTYTYSIARINSTCNNASLINESKKPKANCEN